MIRAVEVYSVFCDSCGKCADEDSNYSGWDCEAYAQDVAHDADFRQVGDKHYCENCYYYDDEDNLIIK